MKYIRQSLQLPVPFLVSDSVIQYFCSLTSFLQDHCLVTVREVERERIEPAVSSATCEAFIPDGIPPSTYGIQELWHAREILHAFPASVQ